LVQYLSLYSWCRNNSSPASAAFLVTPSSHAFAAAAMFNRTSSHAFAAGAAVAIFKRTLRGFNALSPRIFAGIAHIYPLLKKSTFFKKKWSKKNFSLILFREA